MGFPTRTVAGGFVLTLNGKVVGRLGSVEGGNLVGQVVTGGGFGGVSSKHIGAVSVQDLKFTAGPGMAKEFFEWIESTMEAKWSYKDGSVIMLDFNQKPVQEITFRQALIDEVVFPAVDAADSSKTALKISVAPEQVRHSASASTQSLGQYAAAIGQLWTANKFKLSIAGLEKECAQVTKVDAITFSQKVQKDNVGQSRDSSLHPASSSFSNLKIVIPEMHSQGFLDWHEDMVVKGNTSNEKNGTLEYIGKSETYFTLEFTNLGMISYSANSAFGGKTAAPVAIEMYFESMKLKAGAASIK